MVIGVIIVIVSAIFVAKLCATLLYDKKKRNDIIGRANKTKEKVKRVTKKVKDKIDET